MKHGKLGFVVLTFLLTSPSVLAREDEKGASEKDPNQIFDPSLYRAMEYRLVGPSRGGRSTAVTGIPEKLHTFYMGSTGGGVWKTEDGGGSWRNVSDGFFKAGSIGAISVSLSDPNLVYVGTGSACPRGNVSSGIGMYKSSDAGKTWKPAGLEKGGQIARIAVHPRDPDLVYVAALGNIFGPNPERGVFRSRDGGRSWEKVLFVSEETGAVALEMDPGNPRVLYAGMWRAERKPWTLIDGGEEGGVWKSSDGGDSWTRLEGGLPDGLVGRVGIAVSPADSSRIWVIQEAKDEKKGGVFRSDDGGRSFRRVSRDHKLRSRAWYYNHIFAHPTDPDTAFVANAGFFKSVDGGRSWDRIRTPHGDNHDLWINPLHPDVMIEANDGGANVTYNGGKTWSTQHNQPTAEFYRVTVDHQFPYRLYASQQDNSTISVPSRSSGGSSPIQEWIEVAGGESGHVAVDPRDARIVYSGNYIGQLNRSDRGRGHRRDVVAYPQLHDGLAAREVRYRFQWNAPIRISPHDPTVLYHASQYVHRSRNEGQSWEIISPDLTTNNDAYQDLPGGPIQHDHTGVEMYTTIFSLEESPHEPGVLWAGSDDGLVHISSNGGADWKNVTPREMPAGGTVNSIELSAHGKGRAFIAVYRYRRNDFAPYVFRTDDHGETWQRLTDGGNGIPAHHFVRVVREDPDRKGLLYAGTEFGVYVSFDDGAHWQTLQLNLPVTPVTDLKVHRTDLVVATQGRSFWILDDVTPLHQISEEVAKAPAYLFAPRPGYRTQLRGFRTEGRTGGGGSAFIYSYFAEKPEEDVKLEVLDGEGALIRTYSTKAADEREGEEEKWGRIEVEAGMNRHRWDLTYPGPDLVKGAMMSLSSGAGAKAPPGTYRIRLTAADVSQEQTLEVRKDPRWTASEEDLREQFRLAVQVRDKLGRIHDAIRTLRSVREQTAALARRAVEAGFDRKISEAQKVLARKLTDLEEVLIQTRSESSQDPINYPPRIDNQFTYLYSRVNAQDARPTEGCYQLFEDLKKELAPTLVGLEQILGKDVEEFQTLLEREKVPAVILSREKR